MGREGRQCCVPNRGHRMSKAQGWWDPCPPGSWAEWQIRCFVSGTEMLWICFRLSQGRITVEGTKVGKIGHWGGCGSSTNYFCPYPIAPNAVTRPHLDVKGAGKGSIGLWWRASYLCHSGLFWPLATSLNSSSPCSLAALFWSSEFYRWGSWGFMRLSNLPNVTQLVVAESGLEPRSVCPKSLIRPDSGHDCSLRTSPGSRLFH